MADNQNQPQNQVQLQEQIPQPNQQRAIQNGASILVGDYVNPIPAPVQPVVVYPPFGQPNFHLRPDVINLFQNHQDIRFFGKATENPHEHISAFLMLCEMISHEGISADAFRMRLFPHTLKDSAREWFLCLPPGSIQSWNDMVQKFTMKFFPPSRVHQIRNDVHTFKQKDLESYPEAWERFKNFFRKCPSLDIPKQAQQYLFYYGLKQEFRNMIDVLAGGSVMKLDVDEAYDLYEKIAENQSMWPTDRKAPRKTSGLHNVDAVTALAAQMEVLTMKMDNLSKSVNMVHQSPPVCEGYGADHASTRYPLASTHVNQSKEVSYAQNFQRQQNNPFSNTFNPGFQQQQQQGRRLLLEDLLAQYITKTETNFQNQQASIKNLEQQVGQIAAALSGRAQGTLPSNTETNPKEQVKAITTRSGVQLPEIHVKRPATVIEKAPTMDEEQVDELDKAAEENQVESSDSPQVKATVPVKAYVPPIPFPQRLQKHKLDKQFQKFLDVFKKLHINIPFAEALAQMPSYAKFMKDILSNKRKLEDNETIKLTEECSAILQHKLPPKLKDPGSFTIPCNIGLGEAKPTTVSLQLADRSIKHPRGICEDILVKVDKFIFPVDFIILDMEEDRDVPLILGRPFLATGRALIDVQKGQLILRLNKEELTINVFKAFKFQSEPDSCMQIDVIKEAVSETFKLDHPKNLFE
ncbi:uncharacterized protein LOC111399906 [Olea europaea var. sylvestris]|uniref:uncharacterized protein LOC111399906 n=1 Tax=Olea europaea var. sylvestris TaxID=158386 RepID=UPI000C1CFFC7|nr:uncharacterized protein LOC111399906 [Olea europaea var. sylvestris]